ncbi:hypothetical protein HK099_006308 [Clydaea vesicula]|uniref:Uncharacterized protein n=1 Tax=Clydaea vesicula TaxID=447962 RepID=A0AAD5U028_9FUNG|nr:hypothetical protein HK099_006308 [Clydaea vesicula]
MWGQYNRYHETHLQNVSGKYRDGSSNSAKKFFINGNNIKYQPKTKAQNFKTSTSAGNINQDNFSNSKKLYDAEVDDSTSVFSDTSNESSIKSDVYQSTVELSNCLLEKAELEVYDYSKILSTESVVNSRNLFNQTIDMVVRSHLNYAKNFPEDVLEDMRERAVKNKVFNPVLGLKSYRQHQDFFSETSRFASLDGMIPFLNPKEQLLVLKVKEKILLVERWKNLWEEVRPPKQNWYESKGMDFAYESKKCKNLASNREYQILAADSRKKEIDDMLFDDTVHARSDTAVHILIDYPIKGLSEKRKERRKNFYTV